MIDNIKVASDSLIDYNKITAYHGHSYSMLKKQIRLALANLGFDNYIRIATERLGEKFKDDFHMSYIAEIVLLDDEGAKKRINYEKFKEKFGKRFSNLKESTKNELVVFGFQNFIDVCNKRNLDFEEENLEYLFNLASLEDKEFEYDNQYSLFKDYFTGFNQTRREIQDEGILFGFEKFKNIIETRGIDINGKKYEDILYLVKLSDIEYRNEIEYRKFSKEFGQTFVKLKDSLKQEIIEYGFDDFLKIIKDKKIDLNFYNLKEIVDLLKLSNEELNYQKEYDKFHVRFGQRFSRNNEEFIQNLVNYGFNNFIEKCESMNLNVEESRLSYLYDILLDGTKKDYDKEYEKFSERFGTKFFGIKKEKINELIEYGFDNLIKKMKERELDDYIDPYEILELINMSDEDFKYQIEFGKFYEIFGKSISLLSDEKRDIIFKIGFEEFIKRINQRIGGYKKGEKFEVYFNCGIMEDSEYKRYSDENSFKNKFGFSFSSLGDEIKNDLLNFGFDKFMKIVKNRKIDEEQKLRNIYSLVIKKNKEFEYELEYKKFCKEFGEKRLTWSSKEVVDSLIKIGFNEFMKLVKEKNIQTNGRALKYVLEDILKPEVTKKDIEEKKFIDFFGKKYQLLLKEKKNKILEIGFDEFIKRINERMGVYNEETHMNKIYRVGILNDQEYKILKNYDLFFNEYGRRISGLKDSEEFINELCEYGFNNFQNFIKKHGINNEILYYKGIRDIFGLMKLGKEELIIEIEKIKYDSHFGEYKMKNYDQNFLKELYEYGFNNFLNDCEKRGIEIGKKNLRDIIFLLKLNNKEFLLNQEYKKFREKYGTSFQNIKEKWQNILCEYGFDKYQNELKKKSWIKTENVSLSMIYNHIHLTKEEYLLEQEYRKFSRKYGSQFDHSTEEFKKELCEYGFDNFQKNIQEKQWLQGIEDFGYLKRVYDMNEEEFKEMKNQMRLLEIGCYESSFSEENKKSLEKIGYEKLFETIEERGLSFTNSNVFLILKEFRNGILIKNEGDCYICERCGHKGKIDFFSLSRIKNGNKEKICERCFPKNGMTSSYGEREVFEFIFENFSGKMINGSRVIENPYYSGKNREIDIHLVHKNIGFEYNGTYWHSLEEAKIKDQEKIEQAKKQGIIIYTIKEEDWVHNNENEKKRIIEIMKKEGIYSPRNKEEIDSIKNQEKFKDLGYILSQLDNEYEIERLSEFFGKKEIDELSFGEKEELKIFGYHEIIERMKKRNIEKDFILQNLGRNLRRYVLTNFNEYSFNLEDDKFIKHFGDEYFNLTMLHKERLIYFGFEDFINELKRIKSYSSLPNAYVKIGRKLCSDMRKLNKKKLQEEKK